MNPFIILYVLMVALRLIREDREKGIKPDWTKTIVTALSVILVTALGMGAFILVAGFTRSPELGVIGFVGVLAVGLTVVIVAVNRWKPAPRLPLR